MKIIQNISDQIDEEISDANKYAMCSNRYKESDPELSRTYAQLATEELGHVDKLHAQVVRLINEYRASKGEPPAHMKAIYEYMHNREINKVAEIKLLLQNK